MSALVISLDFELFWGVADVKTVENYGANVEGEWQTIPAMLALFKRYGIRVTWATVGMIMCKDHKQWSELLPSVMPTYTNKNYSNYSVIALARDFPKLFFARPLIDQILATDGQELGSHTYSHFYCGDAHANVEQFIADLECTKAIFNECGVKQPTSLVFPRNQLNDKYINVLSQAGYTAYRGNQNHWVYRDGHLVSYGILGRLIRVADSYLPIISNEISRLPISSSNQLINIPATRFFRPSSGHRKIDRIHIYRVQKGMLEAAKTNGIFHLWWHPHNFGVNLQQNLDNLEKVLQYFCILQNKYPIRSLTMGDIANMNFSAN